MKYTTKLFIKYAKSVHKEKYIYKKVKYKNSRTPVIITCPKHGDFEQRPKDHLYGHGCKKCAGSTSKKSSKWLKQFGKIKKERPITVDGTKYIVDGYDRDTNTVYEFWGDFWHGNPKKYDPDELNPITKTTFGFLYNKTKKKIKDIKKAGFNLVSIWENEWDKESE